MKRISLRALPNRITSYVLHLRGQRIFRDKLSVAVAALSLGLNLLTLVLLIMRLRPTEFLVPIRYSSITGFDMLGSWYEIYSIGFFGLFITLANTFLAMKAFNRSRITSFFLLGSSLVVGILCLIISLAFVAVI